MVDIPRPRFALGACRATPRALKALQEAGQTPSEFLDRHVRGDWGDVSSGDASLNDEALNDGSRLLSSYRTRNNVKLWIITEAVDDSGKRAATTIMLPDEY